jgi:hypothetical protein
VALYSHALTSAEVQQNFEFGADTDLLPVVTAGQDVMVNLPDRAMLQGKLADDRLLNDQLAAAQCGQRPIAAGACSNPDSRKSSAGY